MSPARPVSDSSSEPAHRKRPGWRRALFSLTLFAAIVLTMRQTALLESMNFYHPRSTSPVAPKGVEEMLIPTPDGRTLHAWWMPPKGVAPGTRAPAVLHCHGNMGDVADHAPTSSYITRYGVGVLLFDYRGFGRSTPERLLTRDELLIDAKAALDALRARPDVDPSRVGVFGYSLGGTFALKIAADDPGVRCAVAVATFSSWPGVASDVVPMVGRLLIKPGVDAQTSITAIGSRPVLLVHGDQDNIVATYHSSRIADAGTRVGVPVELEIVRGLGHFGLFDGPMQGRIGEFFAKHLAEK
ncbi:MAG: alpha/beta fold hydrolase [Phycisphaerales bacterium]|nr:alpha/beta fold hydrolase [Phycisphaerales bacterium]